MSVILENNVGTDAYAPLNRSEDDRMLQAGTGVKALAAELSQFR